MAFHPIAETGKGRRRGMHVFRWALISATVLASAAPPAFAERLLVKDQAGFNQAAKRARPGDVILLADGEWRDFQIMFEGHGAADKPITLTAQTKGRVILTGQSNLRLAGEYLVVSGLVFRNGYTPTTDVIAFRRDSKASASHSRVTEIVIDGFNQPDRRKEDRWVSLHGRHNRVDHSHFAGKANAGVTLAVIRQSGQPLDNRHEIDHNYFGPRPPLGSNGGETIRIGTSEESLSASNTIVEDNYFERCDGEVEIVSIKSGGNVLRRNTFFESQGALVLRHGNGNLVEDNVFLGNGRANTGGVRVINTGQTVRGNYMEGLAGTGFSSAITVMNGVPNSPINRYHQVRKALIERNSVIDSARITLGAGADAERSAPPIDSRFERNLIVSSQGADPFRVDADISGVALAGNIQEGATDARLRQGVAQQRVALSRATNGLLYPIDAALAEIGAPRTLRPVTKQETGTPWYPKPGAATADFGDGRRLAAGASLAKAIAAARNGDTIVLGAGEHVVDAPLAISRTLTIAGPQAGAPAMLRFVRSPLFRIERGGRLRLQNVTVSGAQADTMPGNAVIRTGDGSMSENYAIEIVDSNFRDLDRSPGFDVIATTPSTLAEHVLIHASRFEGVSGAVIAAHSETGGQGHYNAEQVEIAASEFRNVGMIADIFRSGRDESTFGPRFSLTGSIVTGSGKEAGVSLRLSGVQFTSIKGNRFAGSGGIEVTHSVGTPDTRITDNRFEATPAPLVRELYAKGPPRAVLANNVAVN